MGCWAAIFYNSSGSIIPDPPEPGNSLNPLRPTRKRNQQKRGIPVIPGINARRSSRSAGPPRPPKNFPNYFLPPPCRPPKSCLVYSWWRDASENRRPRGRRFAFRRRGSANRLRKRVANNKKTCKIITEGSISGGIRAKNDGRRPCSIMRKV